MVPLSDDLLDALREVINIGVGKAAGTLNELLGHHIVLEVPQVVVLRPEQIVNHLTQRPGESVSLVVLQFSGQFSGLSTLMFTSDSASKLVDLLVREETPLDELDAIKTGTLTEVGNILLNAVMGSIANLLGSRLNYTIPSYQEGPLAVLLQPIIRQESAALEITTRFTVQSRQITGEFLLLFEVVSFDAFVEVLQTALLG